MAAVGGVSLRLRASFDSTQGDGSTVLTITLSEVERAGLPCCLFARQSAAWNLVKTMSKNQTRGLLRLMLG